MEPARRPLPLWLSPALGMAVLLGAVPIFMDSWNPPQVIRIAFAFFCLFLLPGWLLHEILIPRSRFHWLERIPLALPESLGVFAFPALVAFKLSLGLDKVLLAFLLILSVLLVAAIFRSLMNRPGQPTLGAHQTFGARLTPAALVTVALIALGLAVLAYFVQAFRGLTLDWDYFNYISQVRKLAENHLASNAHFAYRDAPPDPIHSYNLWALLWALVADYARVDPIPLYLNAAFLTVPVAALAFFTLARRLLSPSAALAAFLVFVAYQVVYGGLAFLGATTFFPEDSMWLLCYPCLLALLAEYLERAGRGLAATLALAVVGTAIVHVLWGLGFFFTAGCFLVGYAASRGELASPLKAFARSGPLWQKLTLGILLGLPLVLALAWVIQFGPAEATEWYRPLLPSLSKDFLSVHFILLVLLPLILFLVWVKPFQSGRPAFAARTADEPPVLRRCLLVIGVALLFSLPYMLLRYQTIQVTQWQTFGRNPYRAFLTGSLFFLNPFRYTWADPTMTSYPLYLLGLLALPVLVRQGRRRFQPWIIVSALVAVLVLAWDAPLASLFARCFSLGYLRRILRILGLLSFLPVGALIARLLERWTSLEKRPWLFVPGTCLLALLLALAAIPWPAKPSYYNNLFFKMLTILRQAPRDSLLYDDTPFRFLKEHRVLAPGEVVFSDLFTSYRLTAYLNAYVAVQQKPGVGVPDQDQRRLDEIEFFLPDTSLARIRELADHYGAYLIIINRDPNYQIYGYPCGHPEMIGKLKQDPEHFTLLDDEGDWAIFRFHSKSS